MVSPSSPDNQQLEEKKADCVYLEKFHSHPVNQSQHYLYHVTNQKGKVLPNATVRTLAAFESCQPLSQHFENIQATFPQLTPEIIEKHLQDVEDLQLLRSTQAIYEKLQQDSFVTESASALRYLVLFTHNRPDSFQNCLSSYLENLQAHQRELEVLVIDGSEGENLASNHQIIQDLQKQHESSIYHISPQKRDQYCKQLSNVAYELGVPHEISDFALKAEPGWRTDLGSKRNLAMLSTLGNCQVWADDDTICQFASPSASSSELQLSSKHEFLDIYPFREWQELLEQLTFQNLDIWSHHESLLGHSVQEQIAKLDSYQSWHMQDAAPEVLSQLLVQPNIIDVSTAGIAGDSGMGSPLYLLGLEGENRKRMLASPELYHSLLKNRLMCRTPSCVTFSDIKFLMMPHVGVDNRLFFPPCHPAMRNSDGLFMQVTRKIFRNRSSCFLPLAVKHLGCGQRSFTDEDLLSLDLQPNVYLYITIASLSMSEFASPWQKVKQIGHHLLHLAEASPKDFQEYLITTYLAFQSYNNLFLENMLTEYEEQPDFWAENVSRRLELYEEHLKKADFYIPRFHKEMPQQQVFEKFQSYYRKLGHLYLHWEQLRQAAKEISMESLLKK